VLQVFYELDVTVGIGDVVAGPVMVLDTPAGVGEHVRHKGHAAAVLDRVDGPPFFFVPE